MHKYECPHLGCDDVYDKTRAELVAHLRYWHSSTVKEIDEIITNQLNANTAESN